VRVDHLSRLPVMPPSTFDVSWLQLQPQRIPNLQCVLQYVNLPPALYTMLSGLTDWLHVRSNVDFKLATLMFKSLHGCASSYLSDTCKLSPDASLRLRSSGTITCVIPWSRTCLGDKSFDVDGPRLWNKLPASLRSSDSLCQFTRQLKTFLFVKD